MRNTSSKHIFVAFIPKLQCVHARLLCDEASISSLHANKDKGRLFSVLLRLHACMLNGIHAFNHEPSH